MKNQSNKVKQQIEAYCDKIHMSSKEIDEALEAVVKRTGRINNIITVWCNKAGRLQIKRAMKKALQNNKLKQ